MTDQAQEIERLKAEIERLTSTHNRQAGALRIFAENVPNELFEEILNMENEDVLALYKAEQDALGRFETLLSICEHEFGSDETDDGPVMAGDGPDCQITFKLLRDCRAALDALKPADKEPMK